MTTRVTVNICGETYTLLAEENAAYMEKIGAMVDEKMCALTDSAHVSRSDAAVLTALNFADELHKTQQNAENLRRQIKSYLDEINELKRKLSRAQQQGNQHR